jgi:hypothetical protein
MMRAETSAAFDMAVRWIHVHAWVLIRSFVGFVRLYLRAGRFVAGLGSLRLAEGLLSRVISPKSSHRARYRVSART